MLEQLWDRTSSLLERRFLTNAFIPVLLLGPAVVITGLAGTGGLEKASLDVQRLDLGSRIVLLGGYLLTVWFVASFVQSQWRNLIRLFEGYPLRRWNAADEAGRAWHRKCLAQLQQGIGPQHNLYYRYPASSFDVMPTRLGNALRAAERYGWDRYRADTIILWPRLAALVPPAFSGRVEEFRAALEFLLIVSTWCILFSTSVCLWLVIAGDGILLFLACAVAGSTLAYVAYLSAIEAAVEYGEQLRVGVDLYRGLVLRQCRLPLPVDLQHERDQWENLRDFVFSNHVANGIVWEAGEPASSS